MLLVNSSFVGGLGGARKASSLVRHLIERGLKYRLVTDSQSLDKLWLVGLKPDAVFEVAIGTPSKEIYKEVQQKLLHIKYDALISFGWRTYVPANAVERSKPAVIIDGGWPRTLGNWPSAFWKDVYEELTAYCLTNHFFDPRLDKFLPPASHIPFTWVSQPLNEKEIAWHLSMADSRNMFKKDLAYYGQGNLVIFLDMNPEYVNPQQGTFTGGWLSSRQLDECRGFVTRLLVELDRTRRRIVLVIHREIAQELSPVASKCRDLKVVTYRSLPPEEHHRLRLGADLVLLRAARCVGATQTALSLSPALHLICPASGDYMGEQTTCKIAKDLGIAESLVHEVHSLRDGIMEYVDSERSRTTAKQAQKVALHFWKERGPDYLLNLLGAHNEAVSSSLP